MTPTIRTAVPADTETIISKDEYVRVDPGRADKIRRWVGSGECLVAEVDGVVVGYGVLNYVFFDQGWVDMLAVAEQFRRKGIGRALLRHMVASCRTDNLWYTTNLTNLPAQALLAAEGFRISGFIEGLDEGDPELVFRKVLRTRTGSIGDT